VYKSAADVTREDIVKRHRKLMMINHPDNSKREEREGKRRCREIIKWMFDCLWFAVIHRR